MEMPGVNEIKRFLISRMFLEKKIIFGRPKLWSKNESELLRLNLGFRCHMNTVALACVEKESSQKEQQHIFNE